MARNIERDKAEMQMRKDRLISAGFHLFSQYGIESVSLQKVADAADVGVATMYNYFQNKTNLVIAISGKIWGDVWMHAIEQTGIEKLKAMSVYEGLDFFADVIIDLYKNKPEILVYSGNYKTYICREEVPEELLEEHLKPIDSIGKMFQEKYEIEKTNPSVRKDLTEKEIFSFFSLTMLGMAERYAQGLVWAKKDGTDYSKELMNLKQVLLSWVKGN